MSNQIPATPADVLEISSPSLRVKIAAAVKAAELFGYWRHPCEGAATDLAEMTRRDVYYWVYKSEHPIVRPERGAPPLQTDSSLVGLPPGFEKQRALTLGAGGDLLRCRGIERSKDKLFEGVADLLFDSDISYANLESPITEQPLREEVIGDGGPPIECCSPEQFEILRGHEGRRFTVLHTANNHILDMGLEGLETTRRVLAEQGILEVGTNPRPEDEGRAKTLVRNGIKLGFASATFGLNGHELPETERHRVNLARLCSTEVAPELDLLKRQVDDAKAEGCDFIIASLHWGHEFELFPRRQQIETAHTLVEYGADAILAHHPHVIQPIEYLRPGRDPGRVAVIAYSLGSLAWGFTAPHLVLSTILNLTLAKGQVGGESRTFIETVRATPVVRRYAESGGELVARIERLADQLDGRSDGVARAHHSETWKLAELVLGSMSPLQAS